MSLEYQLVYKCLIEYTSRYMLFALILLAHTISNEDYFTTTNRMILLYFPFKTL